MPAVTDPNRKPKTVNWKPEEGCNITAST